ncbi:segregation/condensation protein A [Verrucomicrobiales bacterium BCK34]|nr:segregation/condensation protein A [Verrucomicrobiales bacterium BCK34]
MNDDTTEAEEPEIPDNETPPETDVSEEITSSDENGSEASGNDDTSSDDDSFSGDDNESSYKVELDIFEGPMDLLLYLIKRDEIDIYDIPIEAITKQYMAYLETFKMLNIGLAGEFLVMAANLCYIKSRMMLPKHVQPPEEDADEEDPRWDLIKQLIEYKKFKEAARQLAEKESKQQNHFSHKPDKIKSVEGEERPLSDDVSVFDLIRAFQSILDRFQDDSLGEIVDDQFTVSDKIAFILDKVEPGGTIKFVDLFTGAASKNELIVTFLAVLELMKLNYFKVVQKIVLGEIQMRRNEF